MFEDAAAGPSVTFTTFSGLGREKINRFTDSFRATGYNFETQQEVVAEGLGGYVF